MRVRTGRFTAMEQVLTGGRLRIALDCDPELAYRDQTLLARPRIGHSGLGSQGLKEARGALRGSPFRGLDVSVDHFAGRR